MPSFSYKLITTKVKKKYGNQSIMKQKENYRNNYLLIKNFRQNKRVKEIPTQKVSQKEIMKV